jgi:hypothetical protein
MSPALNGSFRLWRIDERLWFENVESRSAKVGSVEDVIARITGELGRRRRGGGEGKRITRILTECFREQGSKYMRLVRHQLT